MARLTREGWIVRQDGGHDVFEHPDRKGRIPVPRHRELSIVVPNRSRNKPDGFEEIFMTPYIGIMDGKPGAFGIHFPDLGGFVAMGDDVQSVYASAIEVLRIWARDALDDGEALPLPRDMAALRAEPDIARELAEGSTFVLVPLLLDSGRPARANISIDAGLLEAIDDAAKQRGVTRSAFLAGAARDKIARHP